MGRKKLLDEDALHQYMFDRTDRFQQIVLNQNDLKKRLQIGKNTLTSYLKRMIENGQIKTVRVGEFGVITYWVAQPKNSEVAQSKPKGKIMWE